MIAHIMSHITESNNGCNLLVIALNQHNKNISIIDKLNISLRKNNEILYRKLKGRKYITGDLVITHYDDATCEFNKMITHNLHIKDNLLTKIYISEKCNSDNIPCLKIYDDEYDFTDEQYINNNIIYGKMTSIHENNVVSYYEYIICNNINVYNYAAINKSLHKLFY